MEKPIFEPISHDGRHDSLTNLLAPPLYYQEMARELARFQRSAIELCAIRLELPATASVEEIVAFSDALSNNARAEDLIARTGQFEFALLMRGDLSVVEKFIARIDFEIEISYACVAPIAGEVTLELLNRLDQIELTRATTTFV
jgi:GGDEF domain-containing protein